MANSVVLEAIKVGSKYLVAKTLEDKINISTALTLLSIASNSDKTQSKRLAVLSKVIVNTKNLED